MAKKKSTSYMTAGEQVAGSIYFVLYLLVLPFVVGPFFRLVGGLLGTTISTTVQNLVYYYILLAVTVVIFRRFLARTSRHLVDNLPSACKALGLGLLVLYGLNELAFRLLNLVLSTRTNLNDVPISAQIEAVPRVTTLMIVLLAPFVEEVLFRGLVFGNLKSKSRLLAYAVSCGLFALLHVWQFAVVQQDVTYFLVMLQYLIPGAVLAWAYERSGTLWSSIALHAAANGLAIWAMV